MVPARNNSDHSGRRAACLGSLAGLIATAPMTAVMAAIHRGLPAAQRKRRLPPEQITLALAEKAAVDDNLDRRGEKLLTGVGHFGYGAVCGAAYGLYADRTHSLHGRGPDPLIAGPTFGLVVWAASYLGWLPALDVRRSATKEHAGINTMMIAAHLVWGATTAVAYDGLCKRRSS